MLRLDRGGVHLSALSALRNIGQGDIEKAPRFAEHEALDFVNGCKS